MEKTWKPFPLYIYTHDSGDTFILPTSRNMLSIQETRANLERELEVAESKAQTQLAQSLRESIERIDRQNEDVLSRTETLKSDEKTVRKDYFVSEPSFDEYITAEEASKDWVNGEPKISDSRLARYLLGNNVKLGDIVLTREQVGQMKFAEINVLWTEIKTMLYPNSERLPFLN